MKKLTRTSLALVTSLLLSHSAVWAQPRHGGDNRCNPAGRNCDSARAYGRNERYRPPPRFSNGHDNRPDMQRRDGERYAERGAGPSRDLYRGQRLPSYYRGSRYVVDDWRGHGLRPPPRGYHWVQTGGDYVLVAIATGVILELLLNQ